MTTAAVAPSDEPITSPRTWSVSDPHVRKVLTLIKRGKIKTPEALVVWDRDHGQRLFDWNDATAAEWARRAQAVLFLNRFRATFDKMRIRGIIHVREDSDAKIPVEESGYFSVEAIAEHPGMRAQVIEDLTRRMKVLASELRFWKLTPKEQASLFERLAEALSGERKKDEAA